jgi:CheY-like chemotaxis protein
MVTDSQSILIVEDSPEDFEATLRALRQSNLSNPIFHCADGDDALDFLFHRGAYASPEKPLRPGLILLDLNLPGTDGRVVLAEIRHHHDLAKIPVIAFTISSDEQELETCRQVGADTYIKKPVTFERFLEALGRLPNGRPFKLLA